MVQYFMNSRGNAFVYILIAIILLAGLTYTIGKSNDGADPINEMDENQAKIAASAIRAYAAQAQNAMLRMEQFGVSPDDILYMLPTKVPDFDNPPHTEKLFHPDGGGLAYKQLPQGAEDKNNNPTLKNGYYVGMVANIEWTPSTVHDVVFVAYGLTEAVCQELNWQMIKSRTTPEVQSSFASTIVPSEFHSGSNSDFLAGNCPECDEKPSLCVSDDGGGLSSSTYAFYDILVAR